MAIFDGQVASAVARRKVTEEPRASTETRFANSGAGPSGSRIRSTRSNDRFTAAAVRGFPLEKVRPSRISQMYVVSSGPVKAQDSAASGRGTGDPGSKARRV